jgi:hypothetical protein
VIVEDPSTHEVDVVITRFVEEYQPNIVEWRLADIYGREWVFVGKEIYVTAEYLDTNSHYPLPGSLRCVVVAELTDEAGEQFYRIDTASTWSSVDDGNIFDVRHVTRIGSTPT